MTSTSTTFEDRDNIYRSRVVLLNILKERGYDVERYMKISPVEISAAIHSDNKKDIIKTLDFDTNYFDNNGDEHKCFVRYFMKTSSQTLKSYFDQDIFTPYPNTTVIVMMMDNITDMHHQLAIEQFIKNKLCISFFMISHLTFDPRHHYLVPKHEIVNPTEHDELKKELNIDRLSKLPLIRYHIDPITRVIGAIPGDVIKIVRASPSAGTYTIYRYVA